LLNQPEEGLQLGRRIRFFVFISDLHRRYFSIGPNRLLFIAIRYTAAITPFSTSINFKLLKFRRVALQLNYSEDGAGYRKMLSLLAAVHFIRQIDDTAVEKIILLIPKQALLNRGGGISRDRLLGV
jgi:hypothetical protein